MRVDPRMRIEVWAGGACCAIGMLAMLGWVAGWPRLTSWGAHFATMRPVTALCLLAMGAAFLVANEKLQRSLAIGVAGVADRGLRIIARSQKQQEFAGRAMSDDTQLE